MSFPFPICLQILNVLYVPDLELYLRNFCTYGGVYVLSLVFALAFARCVPYILTLEGIRDCAYNVSLTDETLHHP